MHRYTKAEASRHVPKPARPASLAEWTHHSAQVFPKLDVKEGDRVVDVGCSFGDALIELERRVGPKGFVPGIDCCDAFLELGRRDAVVADVDNVSFVEADVQPRNPGAPINPASAGGGLRIVSRERGPVPTPWRRRGRRRCCRPSLARTGAPVAIASEGPPNAGISPTTESGIAIRGGSLTLALEQTGAGGDMMISRRHFSFGLGALGLSACSGPARIAGGAAGPAPLPDDLRPAPNAGYDAWVATFRGRATARGISEATQASAFRSAGFLPGVVTRDRNQPESTRTLEDYLSIAVSDERVANGRRAYARHRALLGALESRYGVDATIITAIWGLESSYGERRGDVPVISATSTLAFDGRRGAFFEQQLIAALRILQNGDITPERMTGSWAGAMGHTQFIPTSYLAYAVDFDGDGRRDIWSDDPTDALASAAAYLARSGWTRGLRWGGETGGGAPAGDIIQPQAGGPRFAVTGNFRAIKRYNNSDLYAIGVGHLADRIGGGGPLRGGFPPDAQGMTRADRIALQQRLTARGFDAGGADGVIGARSRAAISAYQTSIGQEPTGVPSLALLRSLG